MAGLSGAGREGYPPIGPSRGPPEDRWRTVEDVTFSPALPHRHLKPAWLTPAVWALAWLSFASGVAQFGVVTVVGDVAAAFGNVTSGDDMAAQIGLTATTLSLGLAFIRGSSILALPATAFADRFGRRRTLLVCTVVGLVATVATSISWDFWVFVLLAGLARPFLTTVNSVTAVAAAEETGTVGRSAAIAFVGASYGFGAGVVSVTRGLLPGGFRGVMLISLVPLLTIPVMQRWVRDPYVFGASQQRRRPLRFIPGAVPTEYRTRLVLLSLIAGAVAVLSGPGFTYLFVFGERMVGASESQMSLLILAAGPVGLLGLVVGRWVSDHLGRRTAAGFTMGAAAVFTALTYRGSFTFLIAGYLFAILASSAFGPALASLVAESFPTRVRSTATGWTAAAGTVGAVGGLALFGVLADQLGGFEPAMIALAAPVALTSLLFLLVPETLGTDLDAVTAEPAP